MTQSSNDTSNVIIVGSGPAGYTAAIYAARANLKPILFEGSVTSGGALMNTTEVENFPGFPEGIMGPELMDKLREQAERFGTTMITEDVTAVKLTPEVKGVKASDGKMYKAKAIIFANGSAYKKLGLAREDELSGRGVSYCATCDGPFFRDKNIIVVGGGDSALEEALFLTKFATKVTLVVRRDVLRASKIMVERAHDNPKIDFLWNTEVEELIGATELQEVRLKNRETGLKITMPASGLFVAIGHEPRSELLTDYLDIDELGYVLKLDHTTKTVLPGVFACGDLVDHTYRQAITAAGSGCQAALDAERWLADQE